MNFLVVAMAVAAGVCVEAALTHGMTGVSRRPRDRARLAFAVASLAVAVGSLSVIAMYTADSPQEHAAVTRWLFFPSSAVWMVAVVWFVAFYTGVRPTRWLLALTAAYAAVLVIDLWLPFGMLASEEGALRSVEVGGSSVMLMDHSFPHPLNVITEALTALVFVFLGFAVYRTFRKGDRRRADYVALTVVVFSVATVLDTLTHYGVVVSLYTTQLCFAAVVVATSVVLRREALQTEIELATYRDNLELMVEARVWELDRTNEQLALEVKERARVEQSLQRRVEELDGLQHVSRTLSHRSDLAAALEEACGEISTLFDACHSQVYLLGEAPADHDEGQGMNGGAGAGTMPAVPVTEMSPVFKRAVERRAPVTVEEPASVTLPPDLAELVRALGVGHLLLLPMVARGEVVGVLAIARDCQGDGFSRPDEALARTVADTLAAVVENERLHRRETLQAAENERQRLARDLHDAVTQSIYSAGLIAEALPTVWEREPSEGLRNLARLRRLVRAALAEMRTLLFELRPATLEAAPLCTLLERLADALGGQVEIPVEVSAEHEHTLPPDVKITLYRVAQEAFSNIAKHARASHAKATLAADEEAVVLTVEDDGRGFDPEAIEPERMGLRIMRERLDRIGASLQVGSEPGRGTRIIASWPRPLAVEGPQDHQPQDRLLQEAATESGGEERELSRSHSGAHSG